LKEYTTGIRIGESLTGHTLGGNTAAMTITTASATRGWTAVKTTQCATKTSEEPARDFNESVFRETWSWSGKRSGTHLYNATVCKAGIESDLT
jgi:hypothetical protein